MESWGWDHEGRARRASPEDLRQAHGHPGPERKTASLTLAVFLGTTLLGIAALMNDDLFAAVIIFAMGGLFVFVSWLLRPKLVAGEAEEEDVPYGEWILPFGVEEVLGRFQSTLPEFGFGIGPATLEMLARLQGRAEVLDGLGRATRDFSAPGMLAVQMNPGTLVITVMALGETSLVTFSDRELASSLLSELGWT